MKEKTIDEIKNVEINEEELIRRAINHPRDFQPLYVTHFKSIFLFILHRVGDRELAGDLTQQVFLNALSNLHRYQYRGVPFSAWLFRIAINQCNEFFRKSKRERFVILEDDVVEHLFEELTTDHTLVEYQHRLPQILERLPPEDLYVIELRFFEGRPFKEVAEIIGITETHAKVRTYRILDRMKKMFLLQK